MSTNSNPASRPAQPALTPVAPSLMVKVVMRPMTRVLNPLIGRMAGRRNFPMAAQIRHVGRRSGRAYVTSAGARVAGDVAVVPLASKLHLPPGAVPLVSDYRPSRSSHRRHHPTRQPGKQSRDAATYSPVSTR